MYKLKGSFMEYVGYSEDKEELEEFHKENIKDWCLHEYNTNMYDIDVQVLDHTEGYAYFNKGLITFKENIAGMTEYKVWGEL